MDAEQISRLKMTLERELAFDRVDCRRQLAENHGSSLDAKKREEEEKSLELAMERRADEEREKATQREEGYRQEQSRKQKEKLRAHDEFVEKSAGKLAAGGKTWSIDNERRNAERARREREVEQQQLAFAKNSERETSTVLSGMILEAKRRKEEEKRRDLEDAEKMKKKCEEEERREQERLQQVKQKKLQHQKEVKQQIEERLRAKAAGGVAPQPEVLMNKKLVERAMQALAQHKE